MATKPELDIVVSSGELIEELKNAPKQQFFSTGMRGLDELLGGFAEGDFVVIPGEPGMGKTTFCVSLTKLLIERGGKCLWFSVEMPYEEFFAKFGKEVPLFYVPRYRENKSVEWIEKRIAEAKEKHGINFVFIDHLGMVKDEETSWSKNSIDIVDARLDKIRAMALKYRVCIVGTAEHNKESMKKEGGKSKEMHMENIRGTARLPSLATAIIGIERLRGVKTMRTWQEVNEGEMFLKTDMWINILKSRRTGAQKIRIAAFMDEEDNIREYDKEDMPDFDDL